MTRLMFAILLMVSFVDSHVYKVSLGVLALAELLVKWALVELLVVYWCCWFINIWRQIPWKGPCCSFQLTKRIISYQILVKHQVFFYASWFFFKMFSYVFFLDLKKTFHVTEMRGVISDVLSWNFEKLTSINEKVIYLVWEDFTIRSTHKLCGNYQVNNTK